MKNKIRVAHVIGTLSIGGVEKRLLSLVKSQIQIEDFEKIYILYFYEGNLSEEFTNINSSKIEIINVGQSHVKRVINIYKYLKRINILHLYNFSGVLAGNLAALLSLRKVSIISHYGGVSSLFSRIMRFAERYLTVKTDVFIYNSQSTKLLYESFRFNRKNQKVIVNGIELIEAIYSKKIQENEIIRFLSVGRITRNKNLEFNLKVIKKLKDSGVYCIYDICGDGPDLKRIIRLIRKYELDDIVNVHGFIKKPFEKSFYINAHFLFNCSFSETFGLSVVEAMSQGIVPLVSSVGGLPEVVNNGTAGIILPSKLPIEKQESDLIPVKKVWNRFYSEVTDIKNISVIQSVEKITNLLNNPEYFEKLSSQAIKYSKNFSLDVYSQSVLDLYRKVMK